MPVHQTPHLQPNTTPNAAKSMIADGAAKVKGKNDEPKLEALYEDWQKHAFAVGFAAAVRLLTK